MATKYSNDLYIPKETKLWQIWLPPILFCFLNLIIYHYTNFLVFHTIVETASAFIGFTALTVATTTIKFTSNTFIIFIALSVGWASCIDIAHTLSYKGLNILSGGGGNQSSQLWVCARFLQAISYVLSPYFFTHKLKLWKINFFFLLYTTLVLFCVFSGYFPQTYSDNYGVTLFKFSSEIFISFLIEISMLVFWIKKEMMTKKLLYYLLLSMAFMIASELTLSKYIGLFGSANIIGHELKIFSFWFIYIALVDITLNQPFNMLARATSHYDNIPEPTFIVQIDGTINQANRAAAEFLAVKPEYLVGQSSHTLFHVKGVAKNKCPICAKLFEKNTPFTLELQRDNQWIECRLTPINTRFFPKSWIQIIHTITDRKNLEIERTLLVTTLKERLKEIETLYAISNIIHASNEKGIKELLSQITASLPKAFQLPECIAAIIESPWGTFYSHPKTNKAKPLLEKELILNNEKVGMITIYYHSQSSTMPKDLFLIEEQYFLKSVASQVITLMKQVLAAKQAKIAEHKFKESENHFQAIIDQTSVGIYVRSKTRFLYVNPKFCDIVKQKKEDLLQINLLDLIQNEEATKNHILNIWEKLYQGENSITYQYSLKRKDGRLVTLRSDDTVISWNEKQEYLGLVQDVSEIEHANQKINLYISKLEKAIRGTLNAVSNMVELRDPYTAGHERRVGLIAKKIGEVLGWSVQRCIHLEMIGLVHDIGKISVPTELLVKPTKLSLIEMEFIKIHPFAGYTILKDIEFDAPIAEVIYQHHERLDGSGYPRGLKGDEILPETRIISVADVLEAMSAHRPYRPALGAEAAVEEITRGRGIVYDADVVDAALKLYQENKLFNND